MLEVIEYDENLSVKTQLLNIRSYPLHNHKDFQIFYMLEGELSLTLFYAKYRLQPGSIHIVHSGDVHSIDSITDDNLVLVLSFDSEYFASIFPHFITTVFITNIEEGAFKKRDTLRDQIFAIAAEECEKSFGYIPRINNAAVALINTLMKNFRGFVIDPSEKAFIHKTSRDYIQVDRISRIIQYVYENYPYKISLAEIAERERMSTYYLSHIFHKLVGVNFRDFLSMVRVEMSEVSVLSTNKSITQIAQDMGFSDAKYYISSFYDHMGCHPKEYRKQYADKIYGVIKPDKEEYPISQLKSIIGKHTQYPIFKGNCIKVSHIEIDFDAKTIGLMPNPSSVFSAVGNMCINITDKIRPGYDMSKAYRNTFPQELAIEILRNFTVSPEKFEFPAICLFDNQNTTMGLFTANGLKKPVYYLLNLLMTLPNEIFAYGQSYIALQKNEDKCLLVFNPGKSESMTIDIVTRNVKSDYQLTKYRLCANNSCINFWAQLNFNNQLKPEDIENIDYMSRPDVEFAIVPRWEQYYMSVELAPYDIIIMKFTRG